MKNLPPIIQGLMLEIKKLSSNNKMAIQKPISDLKIIWPKAYGINYADKWMNTIKEGFSELAEFELADIEQKTDPVTLFYTIFDDRKYKIIIDYSDYTDVYQDSVSECDLYFKMQYQKGGYGNQKIMPGGYIPNDLTLYTYLPKLREIKSTQPPSFDVFGRFSVGYGGRAKIFDKLSGEVGFNFFGSPKKVRYSQYLVEVAKSKICIDLPGRGDFCFRLIDYMAVGACIISPPKKNSLHAELDKANAIAYCKEDYSDLIDICNYYLNSPKERKTLVKNSRNFFDNYLNYQKLCSYYICSIKEKLLS